MNLRRMMLLGLIGGGPSLNAPTLAVQEGGVDTHAETESADLVAIITADDGDGFTTTGLELRLNGVLIDSTVGGGPWTPALPDVLPGTHNYVARRLTAEGSRNSATWAVTVAAEVPSLDNPLDEDAFTIGDVVDFEASGAAAGFDANTDRIEFRAGSTVLAEALADVAGVWSDPWDTSAAVAATYAVYARRYWVGVSGQTGYVDSASVDIDLSEPGGGLLREFTLDAQPGRPSAAFTFELIKLSSVLEDESDAYWDIHQANVTIHTVMRATGGGPAVNVSGTRTFAGDAPDVRVEITANGTGTTCQFRVSYDSVNWAHSNVTPNGSGQYTLDGIAAGMVLTFSGSYTTSHSYRSLVTSFQSSEGNAYTLAQTTATLMPEIRKAGFPHPITGTPIAHDALYFGGAQIIFCTDAAVVALGTNDPALTVAVRAAYTSALVAGNADADGMYCSWCSTSQALNRRRRYGQTTNSTGRETHVITNDAGTSTTRSGGTPIPAVSAAHNLCWYGAGANSPIALDVDGVNDSVVVTTAVNVGTLTPNNFALGGTHAAADGSFFTGLIFRVALYGRQLNSTDRGRVNTELAA